MLPAHCSQESSTFVMLFSRAESTEQSIAREGTDVGFFRDARFYEDAEHLALVYPPASLAQLLRVPRMALIRTKSSLYRLSKS